MVQTQAGSARLKTRHRATHRALFVTGWLSLGASLVEAQLNLDLEAGPSSAHERHAPDRAGSVPGWRARGDSIVMMTDATFARSGIRSMRVDQLAAGDRGGFEQTIDARTIDGDRLRFTAYARVEPTSDVVVSLRVRVDGADRLLYVARERPDSEPDTRGWYKIVIDAPLSARAERVNVGAEVAGAGRAWFDDFSIEGLVARSLPAPSTAATRYLRRALAIIESNAVTRSMLDWPAYRDAVMTQARGAVSVDDAHLAVQFALAELGDGHSYFMSPRQMSRLGAEPVGNARTSRVARAPYAELLFDGIGYLHLPGIAGGEHLDRVEFAERVQTLIGALAPDVTRGWMLDLRGNEGGNLWPMLAGIGPLLGDGDIGASLRPDGERRHIWYRDGKAGLGDYVQLRVRGAPVRLERIDAPVAVLIDTETASAAEIIATAFAGRHGASSFGQPTVGATTATRTFPLSDGAALMLAVASVTDRHGRVVDGRIVPHELVAADGNGRPLDEQPVVLAARRWIDRVR